MENHHSAMVIGGLRKMDLTPLLGISLHRRLMAKGRRKNLLPLVAGGLNREVRGCGPERERCRCRPRQPLGPGVHPSAHPPAFLLAPSSLTPLTGGGDFCLHRVFQKHQIFMLTLQKYLGNNIKKAKPQV